MGKTVTELEIAQEKQKLTPEQLNHFRRVALDLWENRFSTDPRFRNYDNWFAYFVDETVRNELLTNVSRNGTN